MRIGKPLRTIAVEPLELPVEEPQPQPAKQKNKQPSYSTARRQIERGINEITRGSAAC
jgi:hypothetical protein